MTTAPAPSWRGVAAEGVTDLPAAASAVLRRRTRALLGSLLRPHRRSLVALVVLVLAQNAASMAGPFLVGVGIDRGIPAAARGDLAPLIVIAGALAVSAAAQALLAQAFLLVSGRTGQEVMFELRQRVFGHLQGLSVAFHERYTSGRMISRLTSDLESINALVETGLDTLATAALSIVSIAVILLVLDAPLGAVSLISLVPLLWLSRWFARHSTITYRSTREKVALVIVHFTESLRGIRAVAAFRREPRNDAIFASLNDDYRRATTASFQLLTVYWPGIRVVGNITTAAALLYGGHLVVDHRMQVGVLAAFLLYLRRFFEPMADVSQFYNSFQSAAAGLEKLAGVLDEPPGVSLPDRPGAEPAGGWRGEVAFRGVDFHYRTGSPVLHDFNLQIPAGQTVALLGATGAGKSTVARLLTRFYDPVTGSVTVDGVALPELDHTQLHQRVVMVTQENFLFSGSIADNIAFGRPGASRADVEAAAEAIGADRFIRALAHGYDAEVGKGGSRLSAGQRQLIALARALLADPTVLILDEASSSLDAPAERAVQRALRTVLAERTAVVIAHRLSTVQIADRVVVLAAGQVVEDGTPEELLGAARVGGGHYAALFEAWRESLS